MKWPNKGLVGATFCTGNEHTRMQLISIMYFPHYKFPGPLLLPPTLRFRSRGFLLTKLRLLFMPIAQPSGEMDGQRRVLDR